MNDYEIVIDGTCDLNKELRLKYYLYHDYVHSLVVIPEKEDCQVDLEWTNFNKDDYYSLIKKYAGKMKTAFATYAEFIRVIEPILKEGKDVILITLSTGISGTYNGYLNYSSILLESYPNRHIEVIDPLRYGAGSGLLAIYGGINKHNHMSFTDNVAWLNEHRHCIHESGTMDDLSFLAKNGRISATKAFFGSLVNVIPFADFTFDGKSAPLGTIKGEKNAYKMAIEYLKETIVNPSEQIVIISNSDREKKAQEFYELLKNELQVKEIIMLPVGESCAVNIGPGLCAYFYLGSPISKNREKEQIIFDKIKNNNK